MDVVYSLQWVLCNIQYWNGRLFRFPSLITELFTDSSLYDYGADLKMAGYHCVGDEMYLNCFGGDCSKGLPFINHY